MLEANSSGTRMVDNGNFTTYIMHRLATAELLSDIDGEPENQRGWMLGRGINNSNPVFKLHD